MSEGKTIDCLYRTMINLNHSLCLSITTVTIIQKRFLLHLSGELLHKTGELEPSISTVTPGFCPRKRSFKPIMISDVFYTALKTETHSILKQLKFIKTWQKKKKISLGFRQDVNPQSFVLMKRKCLAGLISTTKY